MSARFIEGKIITKMIALRLKKLIIPLVAAYKTPGAGKHPLKTGKACLRVLMDRKVTNSQLAKKI